MKTEFDVVDLGTKKGNAIEAFLTKVGQTLIGKDAVARLQPARCVGYERLEGEGYRKDVEARGCQFRLANLATDEAIAQLPPAEVYLAWHFLEHVPNKDWSRKLVQASLSCSQQAAWFRLPSFEQDTETGEGVLREHGMRFTWTNWRGHPSHWLVQDCLDAINDWNQKQDPAARRQYVLNVKPAGYIRNMRDHRVVPIDTPIDVNRYESRFGPKPLAVKFKKPIVAEWEVTVRFL